MTSQGSAAPPVNGHRAGTSTFGTAPVMADDLRTALLDCIERLVRVAVPEVSGTDHVAPSLEGSTLLGVPLDRRREWYHYHHLFRELLGAERRPPQPEQAQQLHVRAAAWCEANGLLELAIDHAQAAGDADRVARLVESLAFPAYAGGRVETARRWFQWFEDHGLIEHYPLIAVLGAYLQALAGHPAAAERWAAAAEQGLAMEAVKQPGMVEALMALLRALLCRGGVKRMLTDAQDAVAGLDPASPWRATALLLDGTAYRLTGQASWADVILAHTVEVATHTGELPTAAAALAERALLAMERHDWIQAETLTQRALAIVQAGQLHNYVVSPLIYAVAARLALHQGDIPQARDYLTRADRMRPQLTHAMPHRAVQTLLELARTCLAVDDTSAAGVLLRQVRDILQLRPDLGLLTKQADELRARLDTLRDKTLGAAPLTTAELRVLPLLATNLSFREIGDRLCISRHTVKAHSISVYRKLGVASRGQAVQRIEQIGLLGADDGRHHRAT